MPRPHKSQVSCVQLHPRHLNTLPPQLDLLSCIVRLKPSRRQWLVPALPRMQLPRLSTVAERSTHGKYCTVVCTRRATFSVLLNSNTFASPCSLLARLYRTQSRSRGSCGSQWLFFLPLLLLDSSQCSSIWGTMHVQSKEKRCSCQVILSSLAAHT